GIFVALARELARGLVDLAEPDARVLNRGDRGCDATFLHVIERGLHRPFGRVAATVLSQRLRLHWRDDVVVQVDPARGLSLNRHGCKGRSRGAQDCGARGGGTACEETAAAHGRAGEGGGRLAAYAPRQKVSPVRRPHRLSPIPVLAGVP